MIHIEIKMESTSIITANNQFRSRRRYDHVSILLWIRNGDSETDWKRIRLHDWNAEGFNFHFDHEISCLELSFRKGASEFSGNPVWTLKNDDERAIMEIILNNSLVRELKRFPGNRDLIRRAIAMVRANGLHDEKKKLLERLGCRISSDDEQLLIQSYRMKYPCHRYGVRVESDVWSEIVNQVLDLTSVMDTLDEMDAIIRNLQIMQSV